MRGEKNHPQFQKGVSLIELLIASGLGLLILTIVMTTYLSIKKSYYFHEAITEIQERGRIATQMITDDLLNVRFSGCSKFSANTIFFDNKNKTFHWGIASFVPEAISKRVMKNSDILIVGGISKKEGRLIEPTKSSNSSHYKSTNTFLVSGYFFDPGDYGMINSCHQVKIFKVSKVQKIRKSQKKIKTQALITTTKNISGFKMPSIVAHLEEQAWFVEKTKRKNRRGEIIYELHRKDLLSSRNTPDGLLEGVSMMRLTFAVQKKKRKESQGKSEVKRVSYLNAHQVSDWGSVIGVEANLLLDSIIPVFDKPHHYYFMGKEYLAKDLQLHKQWSFYVAIRN